MSAVWIQKPGEQADHKILCLGCVSLFSTTYIMKFKNPLICLFKSPIYLFICICIRLFVHLFIHLFVYLSICFFVCLSVFARPPRPPVRRTHPPAQPTRPSTHVPILPPAAAHPNHPHRQAQMTRRRRQAQMTRRRFLLQCNRWLCPITHVLEFRSKMKEALPRIRRLLPHVKFR
jgi:hypothetical protein